MTRLMYDGIDSDADIIPTSAPIVAGYVDGDYAWTAAEWARFPHSIHIGIAVHATTNDGIVLDVETGDATPEEAVNWVLMRRHAGADPTIYCNQQNGWPQVRAAFMHHDVPEPHYWVANYDGDPAIPAGAIAKQYESDSRWDLSSVADYWPGVDPAPKPPTPNPPAPPTTSEEDDMQQIEPLTVHPGEYAYGVPTGKTKVQFGCDGYGAVAELRVVLWGGGDSVSQVKIGGKSGTPADHQCVIPLPVGTYQVTVRREDAGTFPISVAFA